ncbi:ATG17 Autophagy-related protein 17 [Candida maltosa Xu316]|uniref:Autophagy-related protein 17 n=1 Tax=Candida maltosa (strain Xu316) TaxID=1245528 RepID=M3J424_CANMX|nr:hypothetical protein G210_3039 [Candida maltosa Xu316]
MTNDRNSITITKDEVMRWSSDAQATLEKTQEICSNAQSSLQLISQEITIRLPEKLEATEFLYNSYIKQYATVSKQIDMINRNLQKKLTDVYFDFDSVLNPSLNQLNRIMKELEKTKVPSFIVTDGSTNKSLLDFTSIDSINLLKENIEIYKSNCTKAKISVDSEIIKINELSKSLVTKKTSITKTFDSLTQLKIDLCSTPPEKLVESNSFVGTILRENETLESELVSILQMQTNHFDQCMKAVELVSFGNGNDVNLEVLRNDVQELPEVFKELTTVYDIILQNEERYQKFIGPKKSNIESVTTTIKKELDLLRDFKTEMYPKMVILIDELAKKLNVCSIPIIPGKSPIETYSETLQELTSHYVQFLNVYKTKYLSELHHEQYTYPRKFLGKLTEFLYEDIYGIQFEESERRRKWMSRYGKFIPAEFKLPGENELPVVVQIITEGLENVQNEEGQKDEVAVKGEERELIDLIKGVHI